MECLLKIYYEEGGKRETLRNTIQDRSSPGKFLTNSDLVELIREVETKMANSCYRYSRQNSEVVVCNSSCFETCARILGKGN